MADQPLTVLQAAFLESVRPTPAGRAPRVPVVRPAAGRLPGEPAATLTAPQLEEALKRHAAVHGPSRIEGCADLACREVSEVLHGQDALAAHGCLNAAVVIYRDRRVWYPCRSHANGRCNFAAAWPSCPAPFCRLPYAHYLEGTMHDIPCGTVEYHDRVGRVARA